MVFSSPVFLFLFLPIVLLLIHLAPRQLKNPLLLLSSLFFYTWGEQLYVFVMIASMVENYFSGLWIHREHQKKNGRPKLALLFTLCFNLGILVFFKYLNFFSENLNPLLDFIGLPEIGFQVEHLPLGISFFTFQSLSYLIDVYRKDVEVQRNPFHLALYISLFPQLVAGPIVRYRHVNAQILERKVSLPKFREGVIRFVEGMAKKVILADTLGRAVDIIFAAPTEQLNPAISWLGAIAFGMQVYYDFAGYSDMAIGIGKMIGFDFRENFRFPLYAQSIREMWTKWHISLVSWFRDYVYRSIGGGKKGKSRAMINLFIVFLLTGLWHGANWTFVVWGGFHGAILVVEALFLQQKINGWWRGFRHLYVLSIAFISSVFFRAADLSQAFDIIGNMFFIGNKSSEWLYLEMFFTTEFTLVFVLGFLLLVPIIPPVRAWITAKWANVKQVERSVWYHIYNGGGLIIYPALYLFCIFYLASRTFDPFIYFRF